jgi:hypothetical protein
MPLQSAILKGNARLEAVAAGGAPSIKQAPPYDDVDAIKRLQKALAALGYAMPKTFATGEPDGKFGGETRDAVVAFQKKSFPGMTNEWDGRVGRKTIEKLDAALPKGSGPIPPTPPAPPPKPPGPPRDFIVHDVRLFGWKPMGDGIEVNGDTPLQWVIDSTIKRSTENNGNIILKIMAHGLPGFVQCAQGAFTHPTLPQTVTDPAKNNMVIGPGKGGISVADLNTLAQLKGHVKRIEFHSCLVARIGPCFEANGHASYDGNEFCFKLAQRTGAEVKASIHLQYYWPGTGSNNGMHFGQWNGQVFNWGPMGNINSVETHQYTEKNGPPPPGTKPL